MGSKTDVIVGLDVGSSKTCCVIGQPRGDHSVSLIGVGMARTKGVSKGVVVDIEAAAGAIGLAIEAAERQAGTKVGVVFASVAGSHVSSQNSRGVVAVARSDRDITTNDVARSVDAARAVTLPAQREVLHVIPRTFVVDGQAGVRDPIGMTGYRLEVEAHIVTGSATSINNLYKCVQHVGAEVEEVVLGALAGSETALTDSEKSLGVALVDIGAGTTDIAIYIDGAVWHTATLPIGGSNISNDIAIVLGIAPDTAERLKVKYGRAAASRKPGSVPRYTQQTFGGKGVKGAEFMPTRVDGALEEGDEIVEFEGFEVGQKQRISRFLLCDVINARILQLFEMVQSEIKRSGYDGLIPAGFVLTGGTAMLPGLPDLATRYFNTPARIGVPRGLAGLNDALGTPAYSTAVGLVLWGLHKNESLTYQRPVATPSSPSRLTTALHNVGGDPKAMLPTAGRGFLRVLREFLP